MSSDQAEYFHHRAAHTHTHTHTHTRALNHTQCKHYRDILRASSHSQNTSKHTLKYLQRRFISCYLLCNNLPLFRCAIITLPVKAFYKHQHNTEVFTCYIFHVFTCIVKSLCLVFTMNIKNREPKTAKPENVLNVSIY